MVDDTSWVTDALEDAAYSDGFEAGLDGKAERDCPYRPRSRASKNWLKGLADAKAGT